MQTEVDTKKNSIHTFVFVKLFTTKICENYFREEIHDDQCNYKHKIEYYNYVLFFTVYKKMFISPAQIGLIQT